MTRKMKDSGVEWIGEIPEEWSVITLKRAFSSRTSGAWGDEARNDENDRICIRVADFDYSKLRIKEDIEFTKRNYSIDEINKLELKTGDILIEKSGGGELTPVGRTIKYNLPFSALYANFMDRLRVNNISAPDYIQYLLVCFYRNGITRQYIKQTTGIQNLDLVSMLAVEKALLPPLQEQTRIANYLDKKCSKIDETIEKQKRMIEKLKTYKQSVITEAVTKGLNPDVPMKGSGVSFLGCVPCHWIISRFSFETWVRARLGWKGLKAEEYVDDGYIFLATPNIKGKDIDFKNVNYIDKFRYDESPEIKLSVGDVLLTKDGSTLGTANVVRYLPKEATVNSSIAVITPHDNVNGVYLMYLIKSTYIQTIIENKKDGMGVPHLFQRDINKMYITCPPLEEQKEIANFLDSKCTKIDNIISQKETLIEKLTQYKKSLIYECVTGKREGQ